MSATPKTTDKTRLEPRETGTKDDEKAINTPSVPDPQSKKRPLTPDEKVDEAALESMDASDPPSYSPTTTGAADLKNKDKS